MYRKKSVLDDGNTFFGYIGDFMKYTDYLINDFNDERFQQAFRTYFTEEGMNIKNWDALFAEMNRQKDNQAFVRVNEEEKIVGFLQFQPGEMNHWFFQQPIGFIREFWIAQPFRGQGHGSQLLALTEEYFIKRGLARAILTADDAKDFYLRHGYAKEPCIVAKNKMNVFSKRLK